MDSPLDLTGHLKIFKPSRMKFLTGQAAASHILVFILLLGCTQVDKLRTGEGFIPVAGGKIWYSVTGSGDRTPILLLHGGPGSPSYYLNPLLPLGKDRPVIMFDQLGCGRSDRITDTTLMTMDNHIDQIRSLLSHLNIKEFYLYGHSWGTMLGTDYYLKYPEGIKGLILASPCLSAQMWISDADTLISTLPDSIQLVLEQSRKNMITDSTKLAAAIEVYSNNFYNRKQPVSEDAKKSNTESGKNVYEFMWGKSEFSASGTLKNYDRTMDLKKIKIPVLYTTGEFDAARPGTVNYYHELTPNSQFAVIKGAGHVTMHDNAVAELGAINGFLNELEKN